MKNALFVTFLRIMHLNCEPNTLVKLLTSNNQLSKLAHNIKIRI